MRVGPYKKLRNRRVGKTQQGAFSSNTVRLIKSRSSLITSPHVIFRNFTFKVCHLTSTMFFVFFTVTGYPNSNKDHYAFQTRHMKINEGYNGQDM
jgi:hypothetical protein